jgi:uncharacterized membrane protein
MFFSSFRSSKIHLYSAVFSLPEGKMLSFFGIVPKGHRLDVPNGILGMLFYTFVFLRHTTSVSQSSFLFKSQANLLISSLAFASSLFLARKLYIIQEICVVCLSTHVINTTLFIRSIREFLSGSSEEKRKTQ